MDSVEPLNAGIAAKLDDAAALLRDQGANPFRVRAYRRAAETLRRLREPVSAIVTAEGVEGLERLPGIGESLARAVRDMLKLGRFPMLERLRGDADPVRLLATVPGIGRRFAERLHEELGIESLEDLEAAAHDGRLANVAGFGEKRLAGVRAALGERLGRVRVGSVHGREAPAVAELLDLDRQYREAAASKRLPTIAPRRFNPERRAWLPILHASRDGRHYTVLYSNTARAHRLAKTDDWVVIYCDNGTGDGQWTVITSYAGPLRGRRIVRGREDECASHYGLAGPPPDDRRGPAP
jgi:putative hydrolase